MEDLVLQKSREEFVVCTGVKHLLRGNGFLVSEEGKFDFCDEPRSERPSLFHENSLNQLVHDNPRQTTRECDHNHSAPFSFIE